MWVEFYLISGVVYEVIGDGLVCVEDKVKGKLGLFCWDGIWIEGDVIYVDLYMLIYIGGLDLFEGCDIFYLLMLLFEQDIFEFFELLIGVMVMCQVL